MEYPEWCEKSGISKKIAALNYQPLSNKAKIAEFLGWRGYQGVDGWICYGVDLETGAPTKFGQFKPQKPHEFEDGKTAKYLSPKTGYDAIALKMPDPLYWHRVLDDPTTRIVITEGVKKAAALLTCGIPTLALCGVDMGLLNKRSRLVPILAKLAVEGRPATLAFDMDMLTKLGVRDALSWLGFKLKDKGCLVSVATWDEQYKGIDDLLVACGSQSVVDAISEAQSYSAWMTRPSQSTPNSGSDETEDSNSEVEVLISQGSANPPQLFADGLTVPLKNLAHSLGLSVEPFIVCLLPILGARLKAGTQLATRLGRL
jgi:putative DNA primase/helicase